MDSTTRFASQRVGALPFIVAYLEKMELARVIDENIPWEGEVPLGTLVEVMVCNRLLNPKAMYKISEWALNAGVCDYYDVTAEQLNDDRLGRALERIAMHSFSAQSQLILHIVKRFKLDVSQIHYDISSVELYGAYERQLAENAEAQSELENEASTTTSAQTQGPKPMYGRTKSGRKNVKQVQFGIDVTRDGAVPIDLIPFDGNEAEVKTHLENMDRLRRMLPTKKLLYTADSKLDSPENLLANKAAGGQFLCGGVFQYKLTQQSGKFALNWDVDQKALDRLENLDGAYVLKTDLPKTVHDTAKVLQEYKEQIHVERRIGDMKGPLAIAPMFLEKPLRIAGMMYILLWALMMMALMERDVRKSLDGEPMYGIYPENRPSPSPTGRSILERFEDLVIVIIKHHGQEHRRLAELDKTQRQLIELMGIPPASLRAFKNKCCCSSPQRSA